MKLSRLMPILAICALISFSSCSSESLNEEESINLDLVVAPQAKPLELEILELINYHRITNGMNALNSNDTRLNSMT